MLLALTPVLIAASALTGGGGETAVLIIDPANAESMYVANTYIAKRGLPAANAMYMRPLADNYAQFVTENLAGFEGALDNQRIRDHVDYVILPPGDSFFLPASGYVSDTCAPVNRFGSANGYTLAGITDQILGGLPSSRPNQFAAESWEARHFDGEFPWLNGQPSAGGATYRIGAMLGYTGENGNTLQEVLDLIDRSIAADGTHPAGTFYYMETTDAARSTPRDFAYPEAVAQMASYGGVAEHLFAVLPTGKHDALGVMTGWASPDIFGADYSVVPGSFGDHLTSFAGKFDTTSQTKMSEWIRKGTSGTSGAVEEPCNYSGKFPHARIHVLYRQGMTLGEAWLRSVGFLPFQNLLYGDPLTSPWAEPPSVDLPGLPIGPVAGTQILTPVASASALGEGIKLIELMIDGIVVEQIDDGAWFSLDTTSLDDGWHELRVVAYDTSAARHTASFVSELIVDNLGRSISLSGGAITGDLGTRFEPSVAAAGGTVAELRLLHNGRVIAADGPGATTLATYGHNVGAGPVRLQAEVLFTDGRRARSAPLDLDITYTGGGGGPTPVAHDYKKELQIGRSCLIELPATYADDPVGASTTLLTVPGQATVTAHHGGSYAIVTPDPGAAGLDSLSYEVTTPAGTSATATVVLEYVAAAEFPLADFLSLDTVTPSQIPALSPGTAQTVTLTGTGFGPGVGLSVNGIALDGLVPKPYTFVSPTEIKLDMPQVMNLGTVVFEITWGEHSTSNTAEVVAVPPTLQMAAGDPGSIVFQFQGVDAILAGTPGSTHVLAASIFKTPSDLPGLVHLDLGAAFSFVVNAGTFPIDPVQGWTETHIPLANIPIGTTIYAQSVELTPTLPFEESNLQEFFVVF